MLTNSVIVGKKFYFIYFFSIYVCVLCVRAPVCVLHFNLY